MSTPKGVPSGTIVSPAAVRRVSEAPPTPNNTSTPKETTPKKKTPARGKRKSISVVSPSVNTDEGEIIKKGDDEYMVVVTGTDTGLTGKYWSDLNNLPSRRRCTISPQPPAAKGGKTTPEKSPQETPKKSGAAVKKSTKESTPEPLTPKGRKRKADDEAVSDAPKQAKSAELEQNGQAGPSTPAGPAQRNISCLSDPAVGGSAQKEVVVECFAPFDDHRWVNIGKEKNGSAPDAVQYARALRPPYQLLSFLRIKGNCAKGTGCSNKNTMVSFHFFKNIFSQLLVDI